MAVSRKFIVPLLLLLGLFGWLKIRPPEDREFLFWIALIAAAIALALRLVPRWPAKFIAPLNSLRHPSPRTRRLTAVYVFLVAAASLLATLSVHRLRPTLQTHDENLYLIQMRMLAHGHLWHAPYPHSIAKFFESFYLIAEPKYAPIYFPGAAILYLPTIWLNLPTWILPLVASSLCAALMYLLITQMFDGLAGILAAIILLSLPKFHNLSVTLLSQIPMLLFVLLMLLSWLRWRRGRELKWAAILGAVTGFAAIIRPLDAFCLAAPIGISMLLDLSDKPARFRLQTIALVLLAAAPFVTLQLIQNRGITGSVLHSPHEWVAEHDWPGLHFGWPVPPGKLPDDTLPQKRVMSEIFYGPPMDYAAAHSPFHVALFDRLPDVIRVVAPGGLAILLPLGLLAFGRRRWVPCVSAGLYCLLYAFYPVYVSQYAIVLAPAAAIGIMMAIEAAVATFPKHRALVATFLTLLVLGICVGLTPAPPGAEYERPELVHIDQELATIGDQPSVVLFHVDEEDMKKREHEASPDRDYLHSEPVYNTDVEFPDDAKIIRANDLGEARNALLYRYYAAIQPNRVFWLYDRPSGTLRRLGTARDLTQAYR